jgi:hypothetical protein
MRQAISGTVLALISVLGHSPLRSQQCVPATCTALGLTCGKVDDGCGHQLTCGAACTAAACFHEDAQIQFAGDDAPFGRAGLIMHDRGDFGDTAQREGMYWLGVWIRSQELKRPWSDKPPRRLSFDDVLKKLEPKQDGMFVRAPGKDPFGRNADGHENHGTTRDQLVPMIVAMSVWGKSAELQRLWNALPEDIFGKHDLQGRWFDHLSGEEFFVTDPCVAGTPKFDECNSKREVGFLRFTGDPLPPTAYNLFVRAGVKTTARFAFTRALLSDKGFVAGDVNLFGGIKVLEQQGTGKLKCEQSAPDPRDCVDQDMNTTAMLWMSRHVRPTSASEEAIALYKSRPHTYGSYFGAYCQAHGPLFVRSQCAKNDPGCCTDKDCLNTLLMQRMKANVPATWAPDKDGMGAYGAVRWYNRWTAKANPGLAVLWQPIMESLLK